MLSRSHQETTKKLINLCFALQKAQQKRLNCKILSVSQRLGSMTFLPQEENTIFQKKRHKHSQSPLQPPMDLPQQPFLMGKLPSSQNRLHRLDGHSHRTCTEFTVKSGSFAQRQGHADPEQTAWCRHWLLVEDTHL